MERTTTTMVSFKDLTSPENMQDRSMSPTKLPSRSPPSNSITNKNISSDRKDDEPR